MTVKRIIANIAHPRPEQAKAFYRDIQGMDVTMDLGGLFLREIRS